MDDCVFIVIVDEGEVQDGLLCFEEYLDLLESAH